MGLDTTHGCFHGPYSSFMRWRTAIAKTQGIALHEMQGYTSLGGQPWDEEDILTVLLSHSDCDGEISPTDAAPLADRLEGIIPLLPEDPAHEGIFGDRKRTRQFIDGLRIAARCRESVGFH